MTMQMIAIMFLFIGCAANGQLVQNLKSMPLKDFQLWFSQTMTAEAIEVDEAQGLELLQFKGRLSQADSQKDMEAQNEVQGLGEEDKNMDAQEGKEAQEEVQTGRPVNTVKAELAEVTAKVNKLTRKFNKIRSEIRQVSVVLKRLSYRKGFTVAKRRLKSKLSRLNGQYKTVVKQLNAEKRKRVALKKELEELET
mmetsp:Transcript_109524/g.194198  ORF Transcript_109524/g.194198 Transcript_109524/m.194198 type:complete len:195 (+) Transcript_109524:83-667(+)